MAKFYNGSANQANIEIDFALSGGTTGTQPEWSSNPFTSRYVRVGKFITFFHFVDFSVITNFGTGQYFLTLPFAPRDEITFRAGSIYDGSEDIEYQISGHCLAGENTMYLYTTDISGQALYDYRFDFETPVVLDTSDHFHISGTYFIN